MVKSIIDVAVGDTRPDLTLLFARPARSQRGPARWPASPPCRCPSSATGFEEADQSFFARVAKGYQAIAAAEPQRVKSIPATGTVAAVAADIWHAVEPLLGT